MLFIRRFLGRRFFVLIVSIGILGSGSDIFADTFTIDFTAWPSGTNIASIPKPEGFSFYGTVDNPPYFDGMPNGTYAFAYGNIWDFTGNFDTSKILVTKLTAEVIAINRPGTGYYMGGPNPTFQLWTSNSWWAPFSQIPCVLEDNQPYTQCSLSPLVPNSESPYPVIGFRFGSIGSSDYNFSWWMALISKLTVEYQPKSNLDLAITPFAVTQPGAVIGPDGILNVAPGAPVQINIPLTGTGFNPIETRSTTITLSAGSHSFSQNIPLSAIQAAAGTLNLPFTLTFDPNEVGVQTITVKVNPDNSLGENNYSNNTANVQVKVVADYKLELILPVPSVYPDNTSGDNDVLVKAKLTEAQSGNPVSGKAVQFSTVPKDYSGGHQHVANRPVGTFDSSSCTTGTDGTCTVTYSASEFGGVETITGVLNGSLAVKDSKDLIVRVPNLTTLGGSNFYRLTGNTGNNVTHPSNHFASGAALTGITGVALDFNQEFDATLGINDMSLESGGLFDIDAHWTTPHNLHREGLSADIDRCALSTIVDNENDQGTCPNGWIAVPRKELKQICIDNGGRLVSEPTYHCEF